MNEISFWDKVRKAFNDRPHTRARKLHAGMFDEGLPDAIYVVDGVQGLLELKYVPAWPKRESTTVPCGLTVNQREWMADWVAHAGRAHLLLGVADEWFLFDVPPSADTRYDRLTFQGLRSAGMAGTMKALRWLPGLMAKLPGPALD